MRLSFTGEGFGESGSQDKHHFANYERDSETGTDYAVNRQHRQSVGRFMQADRYKASGGAKTPQSWNRYSYVSNDPINFVDPIGLFRAILGPVGICDGVLGQIYCMGLIPFRALPVIHEGGEDEEEQPATTCQLKLLKAGDPILGGYPDQTRVPADFNPNKTAHGGHLSPNSVPIGERHYYYYFEVQALINSIGNQSDWFFQRRLRRRGWFTYVRADGSESDKINVEFDDPAEQVGTGNFIWDGAGYHYLDNPGLLSWFLVKAADGSEVYRKVKRSNIVWDFTVTGHHTSGGKRDVECNTLKFRLRLRVGEKEPWSFGQ